MLLASCHARQSLAPIVLVVPVVLVSGCDGNRPVEPAHVGVPGVALAVGSSLRAPSALTATAVSYDRVYVSWVDNSVNEDGFEIHLSATGNAGTFALRATVPANRAWYTEVRQANTQYCYEVRAVRTVANKSSASEFSNVACTTTPQPPSPPTPPPPPLPNAVGSLDVIPDRSTVVWMTWGSSLNHDGFRVERSMDGGTSWSAVATVPQNQQSYYDGGLTSEQRVCYRVIAYNAVGDAQPSGIDCTTPPRGPTNLVGTLRADGAVDLRWTDNSAVEDGYEVWLADLRQGEKGQRLF